MSTEKLHKILFGLSIGVLLYFATLIYLYSIRVDTKALSFIRELFTLPMVALLVFLLVKTVQAFIKMRSFKILSLPFYTLVILLFTIAIMFIYS